MCKRIEANVIKRGGAHKPLYLVVVRETWKLFGKTLKAGPWKDTGFRSASRVEAAKKAKEWQQRRG